MQNDTIINALSEKIERLEAENANLKHSISENKNGCKNAVQMFETENTQLKAENESLKTDVKRISWELLTKESDALKKAKGEVLALEKWNKEHREKIEDLQTKINSYKGSHLYYYQLLECEDKNKEHREKIALIEKENEQYKSAFKIVDDDNKSLTVQILSSPYFGKETPQWKNSVKDGLPDLDSDPVAVITICGGIIFMHHTMEDEDMEKLNNFDTEYYYFLVPRVGFDKIKKDAAN